MRDLFDNLEKGSLQDPIKSAAQNMRMQLPTRFYDKVEYAEVSGGFAVHLDGRPVKTPSGNLLLVPTREAIKILADEWQAQQERIDPLTMPVTRLVNAALDGVAKSMNEVRGDIVRFAGSDLLCYRADSPEKLIELQQKHWNPILDWVQLLLGERFDLAEGVVYQTQPAGTINAFASQLDTINHPIVLACLHSVTSQCGSAIIALAIWKDAIERDAAWKAAHVDEDWQISQWGEDSEAKSMRNLRRIDFDAAVTLLDVMENV